MNESLPDTELVRLLVALLDGTLDDDGHARLRALLRDARHRAVYIDLMRMHAMLQWRFGQPSAEPRRSETESLLLEVLEQEQSARDRQAARDAAACNAMEPRDERLVLACPPAHQPLTPVRHIVIPRWMIYGGIAALLIVSALLFLPHGQTPIHTAPPRHDAPAAPVAKVLAQVEARWEQPLAGESLQSGVAYHLVEGFVRLELNDGTQTIIEAPSRFTIETARSIHLASGRLVGTCPPGAVGFAVRTPTARVVDLGTEFGVDVSPQGDTQTHVFSGSVQVSVENGSADTPAVVVFANNAVRIDAAERTIRPIAPTSHQYVRGDAFQRLSHTAPDSAERRWLEYRRWLQRQPELLALYAFEQADREANVLHNLAPNPTIADGVIEGGNWMPGRFASKNALDFHDGTGVRVNLYGPYAKLTVATWVWLDDLEDRNIRSGILMSDGNADQTPDRIHFQLQPWRKARRVSFGYFDPQQRVVSARSETKSGHAPEAQWCHLVAVFDTDERSLDLYINGEHVGREPTGWRGISIGEATIGGWSAVGGTPDRTLHGRIDELAVFQRALSPTEVRQLYRLGAPDEAAPAGASDEPVPDQP